MLRSRVRKRFHVAGITKRRPGTAPSSPSKRRVRMSLSTRRGRIPALVSAALGVSLVLAGCGGSNVAGGGQAPAGGGAKAGCEAYTQYGDLSGKTVSLYTSIV